MPAKVDDHWKDSLVSLKVNHSNWGGVRLWQALREQGGYNAPSQGWVSKWLREDWPKVTEAERQGYRAFYWPESMERGDLPWEASESALELLHHLDSGGGLGKRPLIRFVRWFWRVSQAVPGCPVHGRWIAAQMLTSREVSGGRVSVRGVEWWLAYRPWDGEAHGKSYRDAHARAENAIPLMEGNLPFSESELENNPELRAWVESLFTRPLEGGGTFSWTMMPDGMARKIVRSEE